MLHREPISYARASVRHDGRLLAVGTDRGVVLWDLGRGTELAFLPIGNAWHVMFETSGDLITGGSIPACIGGQSGSTPGRGEFSVGSAAQLPLNAGWNGFGTDRSGRIVARADYHCAFVTTPERTFRVGPLDDCRERRGQPGRQVAGDRQSRRRVAAPGLAHRRPQAGGRAAHRWGARGSPSAPTGSWLVTAGSPSPALGGRHLARGWIGR